MTDVPRVRSGPGKAADLLLLDAAELVTMDDGKAGPLTGRNIDERLGIVPNGGLALAGGRIVGLGPSEEIERTFRAPRRLRLPGRTLLPGFVEPHTHPIFARWREHEFELRTRGASYEEILAAGGGIHASAAALAEAGTEALTAMGRARLDELLKHGVVAAEGKSGYGLDADGELRSLSAWARAGRGHPIHVVGTFLGAHVVPKAYARRRGVYVNLLVREMIPLVAARRLASFCDVFVERNAFTIAEARKILRAGLHHGLLPKVHADQFRDDGAARLAAEVGAVSAEHLDATGPSGIRALAKAGVVAVLLPTAGIFTGDRLRPDARRMIDAGVPVALSTDLNPGTSPTANLSLAAGLACALYAMTPGEALAGITRNAAAALDLDDRFGRLAVGRKADIVAIDAPTHVHLPYRLGQNLVQHVLVAGRRVVSP